MLEAPTTEAQWQRFFSDRPYVLSMSLPLKLKPHDILPLGRLGRSEPDFVFFPRDSYPIPSYGVIELKRPDSNIVAVTRSNVAVLSRDAETAIQQTKVYARAPERYLPHSWTKSLLFLGSRAHMFVIMGMSAELNLKLGLGLQIYRELIEERLPPNLQLIRYDILLDEFESRVPIPLYLFITPRIAAADLRPKVMFEQTAAGIVARFSDGRIVRQSSVIALSSLLLAVEGQTTATMRLQIT